jgi:hypothetical protein
VQTKILLCKVRNLHTSTKARSKDYAITLNTPSEITHYNDKWRRHKDKVRNTFAISTAREPVSSNFSNSLMRSFAGLNRYPSVQRYQSTVISKMGVPPGML